MDSQKNLPGWNFCVFFIMKEGLARMYHMIKDYVTSYELYNELELAYKSLNKVKGTKRLMNRFDLVL